MGIRHRIRQNLKPDSMPIGQAFREYLTEKEAKNLSKSTMRNYRQSCEMFMEFHDFPDSKAVDEITNAHLYQWINAMKQNGVKPSSINHYLRDLRSFLYWCMDDERKYIRKRYKINMIEEQEEQLKLYTDDELLALLEKPRNKNCFADWRTWAIVNWILGTGNRSSTLCEIQIGDINFSDKEIALRHTKNKKTQIVPLSPSLESAIKEYMRMWRKDAPQDAWLFPNIGEDQLTTNALRHSYSRYCKDRGVSKTNIHGLRHNFAKGWVKNNGNMFVLQKVLGHSDLAMTKKYVKLFSDDIKQDFNKYAALDTIKQRSKRTQLVKRTR